MDTVEINSLHSFSYSYTSQDPLLIQNDIKTPLKITALYIFSVIPGNINFAQYFGKTYDALR